MGSPPETRRIQWWDGGWGKIGKCDDVIADLRQRLLLEMMVGIVSLGYSVDNLPPALKRGGEKGIS